MQKKNFSHHKKDSGGRLLSRGTRGEQRGKGEKVWGLNTSQSNMFLVGGAKADNFHALWKNKWKTKRTSPVTKNGKKHPAPQSTSSGEKNRNYRGGKERQKAGRRKGCRCGKVGKAKKRSHNSWKKRQTGKKGNGGVVLGCLGWCGWGFLVGVVWGFVVCLFFVGGGGGLGLWFGGGWLFFLLVGVWVGVFVFFCGEGWGCFVFVFFLGGGGGGCFLGGGRVWFCWFFGVVLGSFLAWGGWFFFFGGVWFGLVGVGGLGGGVACWCRGLFCWGFVCGGFLFDMFGGWCCFRFFFLFFGCFCWFGGFFVFWLVCVCFVGVGGGGGFLGFV